MKRTILMSLSLCLCVGFGADIYAQETPPVDQLMKDGSQAYQHGDFEQAVERWTQAAAAYERSAARAEQIDALIRLSEAYQSLGRYRTAAIRLDQAKALVADTRRFSPADTDSLEEGQPLSGCRAACGG